MHVCQYCKNTTDGDRPCLLSSRIIIFIHILELRARDLRQSALILLMSFHMSVSYKTIKDQFCWNPFASGILKISHNVKRKRKKRPRCGFGGLWVWLWGFCRWWVWPCGFSPSYAPRSHSVGSWCGFGGLWVWLWGFCGWWVCLCGFSPSYGPRSHSGPPPPLTTI